MLNFTDTAKERVLHFLDAQRSQGVSALRVAGNAQKNRLFLVKLSDKMAGDTVFDAGGFEVYLDPATATALKGATVDFIESVMQSGFRVYFPSPAWGEPLAQRVQDVIDSRINPGVAGHGGRVRLVRVQGDTAEIAFEGGCQGCGAANVTLKQGIDVMLKEAVPEIRHVVDVTDHASGENPYYAPDQAGQTALQEKEPV